MTQALNLANFANNLNTSGQTSNSGLQNSSINIVAGTGMSGGGSTPLGGSATLNNAGVTSVIAGSGISVSAASGNVTISNTGFGVGIDQSWVNFTVGVDRIDGTTYTNSTGKPIMVAGHVVTTTGGSAGISGTVNGVIIAIDAPYAIGAGYGGFISFIVPNGSTYTMQFAGSNGYLAAWNELR